MNVSKRIDRRTVLRGLGTAVALPWLEAMSPTTVSAAAASTQPPVRLAYLFVPNGVHLQDWTPKADGFGYDLPFILEPLRPVRDYVNVLSGLTNDKGRANGDGPGDHARAASVFLTGAQPHKTSGANIRVGISIDQVVATMQGDKTRFPSLELGCDRGRNAGQCDSGYSCAYSSNISWRGESTPMAKEADPRQAFDRLFGTGDKQAEEGKARREFYKKSVLDFVRDDSLSLMKRLGRSDQRKLDEYFTGIRELESRIEQAERDFVADLGGYERPSGIPREYEDHLRLMGDILALAFQTDSTRVATFMFAGAGSNRSYHFVNVPEGHHELSHHRNDPEKLEKLSRIDRFHMVQFSYLLQRLRSISEGDGTLLDNCLIMYGSGISDGNRHNKEDLPILLAGRAGGQVVSGRHIRYVQETPLCNLYLNMVECVGIRLPRFGDSTGRLPFLT